MKKYIVTLSCEERQDLESLVKKGFAAAYRRTHAQILLLSDTSESGPGWPDEKIALSLGITVRTVENIRRRLVMEGVGAALERKQNPNSARKRIFDGDAEAHLIALACSHAPEGHSRWTLRLLANKVVELEIVEHADHVTVMRTLKKTNCIRTASNVGAFRRSKAESL